MQIFKFLNPIWCYRKSDGRTEIQPFLLPSALSLTKLSHFTGRYRPVKRKSTEKEDRSPDTCALRQFRQACHDFDLEVQAWEKAAYKTGGSV